MAKGKRVKFRCPKCRCLDVHKAKIPGIKAYVCPDCSFMSLVDGFIRIEEPTNDKA